MKKTDEEKIDKSLKKIYEENKYHYDETIVYLLYQILKELKKEKGR